MDVGPKEYCIQPLQNLYAPAWFGMGPERRRENVDPRFGRNIYRPRRFVLDECDGAGFTLRKRHHDSEPEDGGSLGYLSGRKPSAACAEQKHYLPHLCIICYV